MDIEDYDDELTDDLIAASQIDGPLAEEAVISHSMK